MNSSAKELISTKNLKSPNPNTNFTQLDSRYSQYSNSNVTLKVNLTILEEKALYICIALQRFVTFQKPKGLGIFITEFLVLQLTRILLIQGHEALLLFTTTGARSDALFSAATANVIYRQPLGVGM